MAAEIKKIDISYEAAALTVEIENSFEIGAAAPSGEFEILFGIDAAASKVKLI
jgi:hypothetical protein